MEDAEHKESPEVANTHTIANGRIVQGFNQQKSGNLAQDNSIILRCKVLIAALSAIALGCNLVFGIPSLILAAKAFREVKDGNTKSAKRSLLTSLIFSLMAIAVMVARVVDSST